MVLDIINLEFLETINHILKLISFVIIMLRKQYSQTKCYRECFISFLLDEINIYRPVD